MKQLVGNATGTGFTFNATSSTILFSGSVATLTPAQILLITNVTRKTIIYSPQMSGKGYTSMANGLLTLEFDTNAAGHSSSDILQIFYDNTSDLLIDLTAEIRNLINTIANPLYVENGGVKLNALSNLATIANVTTVATTTNLTNIGGITGAMALTDRLMEMDFLLIRNQIATS